MRVEMKFVETSEAIDLMKWGFATGGEIEEAIGRVVTGALRTNFVESPPCMRLPFKYAPDSDGANGPAVSDPLTLDVEIFLGSNDYDGTTFRCSLGDVIDDLIDDHVSGQSGKIEDADYKHFCGRMVDRLRELAEKLDTACR